MNNLNLSPILLSRKGEGAQASLDCDCACASVARSPTYVLRPDARYTSVPNTRIALDPAWHAAYAPGSRLAVLNAEALRIWERFDGVSVSPARVPADFPAWPQDETAAAVADLVGLGLIRPVVAGPERRAQADTLSVWLQLTERCNLACAYCYVRHRQREMSKATSEAVVGRIVETAKRHGYERVRIKYGGGEPTLVLPRLLAVHDHLAAEAAGAGIGLEPILMTNGVAVRDAQLQACADRGLRLAVSLDGGPRGHNAVRCLPEGQGTYDAVVRTITQALDRGMPVSVSITLAAQTLMDAEVAVAFAMDHDIPFNLNFVRVGGDAGGDAIVPRVHTLTQALRRCLQVIESRMDAYAHPLTGIIDRVHVDVPHAHTCAAGRDYLAIDTQGRTAPCQMLLDDPWGSMTEAAPLDSLRAKGSSRFGVPVDDRPDCAACLWRYACAGGCPLLRKTKLHDRYCRVYRMMLPEVIALEGRRLLTRWMAA